MSSDQPKEKTTNQAPQDGLKSLQSGEPVLVTLFSEITGESESQARSTFMFVGGDNEESKAPLSE
jgi:hypothetical protein